jgi:hypothetical protein
MAETSWRMEEYAGEINKIFACSGLKYKSLLINIVTVSEPSHRRWLVTPKHISDVMIK